MSRAPRSTRHTARKRSWSGHTSRDAARAWQVLVAEVLPTRWQTPRDRIIGVFELLTDWFSGPGYRGCPFINASAEADVLLSAVTEVRERHRAWVPALFTELANEAGAEDAAGLSAQLVLFTTERWLAPSSIRARLPDAPHSSPQQACSPISAEPSEGSRQEVEHLMRVCYIFCMRTTVDLPPDLLAVAKERAAREGRSLSDVVGDAVRSSFARTAVADRQPVELPTFGSDGLQPGVDLDDSSALLDLMERSG